MLRTCLIALVLLPFPVLAQEKPAPDDKPIVITGVRLSTLRERLAACLARKCPPDQDIDASTAVAEEQFIEGKYSDARLTLRKTIDRNKGFAKDYPVPVSELYRADSRIAAHQGEGKAYQYETYRIVDALKAGLPANDPRILKSELALGDMIANSNKIPQAADQYDKVSAEAAKFDLPDIRGAAMLRVVALYAQLSLLTLPTADGFFDRAKQATATLHNDPDPRLKSFALAADMLMEQVRAKRAGTSAPDTVPAADIAAGMAPTERPTLIYSPPMKGLGDVYDGSIPGPVWTAIKGNWMVGQWADIGYWVRPDGSVGDVTVLRGGVGGVAGGRPASRKFTDVWTFPIIQQIKSRRYARLAMDPSAPGVQRVERYSLTAWEEVAKGTRLMGNGKPRLEMLDMTTEPPRDATTKGG